MPARSKTGASRSGGPSSPQSDDSAYKMKRKKNNEAVKKTRAKSQQEADQRKKRIQTLKELNIKLEAQIEQDELNKQCLAELLVPDQTQDSRDRIIEQLLKETSDDKEPKSTIN